MKKFNFIAAISAVTVLVCLSVFYATSCKEKDTEIIPEHLSRIDDVENLESILPATPFQKITTVKTTDQAGECTLTFRFTSNDQSLVEAFDDQSVNFRFLNESEVYEIDQQSAKEDFLPEKPNSTEDPEQPTKLEIDRKVLKVSLVKIASSYEMSHLPAYEFGFSERIVDLIRQANAATVFEFGQIEVFSAETNSRACNPCTIWDNNKRVKILGDCGNVKTKTDNYTAPTGQSQPLSYLNTTTFKCNATIGSCCRPGKWIRTILVLQDVVVKLKGLSNSCSNEICPKIENNNCSGYYPNGCE